MTSLNMSTPLKLMNLIIRIVIQFLQLFILILLKFVVILSLQSKVITMFAMNLIKRVTILC